MVHIFLHGPIPEATYLTKSIFLFESCYSKDGGLHQDMKVKVSLGLKTFGALKMTFNVWSVCLVVKRELY